MDPPPLTAPCTAAPAPSTAPELGVSVCSAPSMLAVKVAAVRSLSPLAVPVSPACPRPAAVLPGARLHRSWFGTCCAGPGHAGPAVREHEAGWHKHHSPALLGTLCCAGCLPGSLCFFGLLLLSNGTENRVPQQSGPTLCCKYSHSRSGTEKSLAQTQQVPADRIGSLPTRTVQVKADLSALLPRKHVPFSQKGGHKVEISRVHVPPASALRSPGPGCTYSASVALSLRSRPLAPRGRAEGAG